MIKNLGLVVKEVKKKLPEYLELHGINTKRKLFTCPNREAHANQDAKPSANFFPNNESWHCFTCGYKEKLGDIFDALHLLEGKSLEGENFFEAVKYLCNKFKIPYEEVTTEEEEFFKNVSSYLKGLATTSNSTLKSCVGKNEALKQLLCTKQWTKSIDKFSIGYLNTPYLASVNRDILAYLNLDPKMLVNRAIIPIRDIKGNIVGLTTRSLSLNKDDLEARYKHFVAYNLKNLLFNINTVDPSKEVVVVEGPSSVLTLYNYGITNCVATFGNLMQDSQYSLLVKKKVKKILFLYDGDVGGSEGLRNSLETLCKGDIDVRVGFLKDNMDPGDYVIQNLNLDKIKKVSLYDYLIHAYDSSNKSDKKIEKCLMTYLSSITDLIKKETMVNSTSKNLKINKSTLTDLMAIYEKNTNVSVASLLKERDSLVQVLTDYERWTWSRGQMLGLKSFKSFDMKLDGLQNGLILVGGRPNIGKSALLISIAVKILQNNPNPYLLYFTIDDSIFTTVSRFIANVAELPINVVSNPNFKITKADLPEEIKAEYTNRREQAISFLRDKSSFVNIKDIDEGSTIEKIKEKIKTVGPLAQGKQLVVFIDNLHNLKSNKYTSSERHLYSMISNELNMIASTYKCPLIASTHITKEAIRNKIYDGTAVKDTVDLDYDAKLIIFVDTVQEDLDNIKDDLEIKTIIAKNKFSGFKGKIDQIFYRSYSKVEDLNIINTKQKQKKDEKNLFD